MENKDLVRILYLLSVFFVGLMTYLANWDQKDPIKDGFSDNIISLQNPLSQRRDGADMKYICNDQNMKKIK